MSSICLIKYHNRIFAAKLRKKLQFRNKYATKYSISLFFANFASKLRSIWESTLIRATPDSARLDLQSSRIEYQHL